MLRKLSIPKKKIKSCKLKHAFSKDKNLKNMHYRVQPHTKKHTLGKIKHALSKLFLLFIYINFNWFLGLENVSCF
ncbi:hypothetical protein HanPSC8_Chr09g0349001 [Helianthus annuus]|nr:hypothetical protein HanPSC8_Chr09g0349001 [Helianthus annuus]